MTNDNRITVDLTGNWRLYSSVLPQGIQAIGTVTRGDSDTGALVLIESSGLYAQLNAGNFRSLDQRKVKAALGISNGAGRPAQLNDARDCKLSLDAETRSIFKQLGDGKMSVGARKAAQIAKKHQK